MVFTPLRLTSSDRAVGGSATVVISRQSGSTPLQNGKSISATPRESLASGTRTTGSTWPLMPLIMPRFLRYSAGLLLFRRTSSRAVGGSRTYIRKRKDFVFSQQDTAPDFSNGNCHAQGACR